MIQVSAILRNTRDAAAWDNFLAVYLSEEEPKKSAKEKLFAERKPVEPAPLEQAIEEKKAAQDKPDERPGAEQDPFAMLSGDAPAAEAPKIAEPEKPAKKATKKKTEDRQTIAEPAPLLLVDIRRISDAVCEAIGMDTIREALAKFAAKDDKGTLRMSSLRTQDYALYVEFLNKKMNDAGKEKVS